MERSRWSRYLEDPSRLVQEESDPIGSLEPLLQRSPYCQILQLLQCKALKDSDRIDWKEKAREKAILVPDRKKLFQLMEAPSPQASPDNEDTRPEKVENDPKGSEQKESALNSEEEEAPPAEADRIDPAPLEQEILSEALQNRILYDAEDALIEGTEGSEEAEIQEEDEKKGTDEEDKSRTPSKKSFTDWLDPHAGGEEEAKDSSEQELIQAFIEQGHEHPVRKQQESEFFSSERMAEKSSDESTLPVSETLAELYVQQGELKRAIEAFERLRLKVPEKKDYFARRVQELKERTKR